MKFLFLVTSFLIFVRCEGGSNSSLSDLFYSYVQDDIYPCFRLTNATHQIGCSGSATTTKGVLYYVNDTLTWNQLLQSSRHAPYVALLEPAIFTADMVLQLKKKSSVSGIIVRHVPDLMSADGIPSEFSPEKKCPNELSGEISGCSREWNPYGTNLIFTDFGDFPIFAIASSAFDDLVKCYTDHSWDNTGGNSDYPLCAVELTADMAVVRDTPTCFRRQSLPVPYLNGQSFCDPLGDYSPWGSLFNLSSSSTEEVTLLTAKLDSISFFPGVLSPGASSEVAAIATLMGVIKQLGEAKRSGDITETKKRILYAFLHGESWDYIGSSRMAYDMKNGNFPHNSNLPRIGLNNITSILELSQLGFITGNRVYVHGDSSTPLIQQLMEYGSLENLNIVDSSVSELPPASLQRFIREGVKSDNPSFNGSVLTGYDGQFTSKYFGSRFDNIHNLGNDSLSEVAEILANLSTAVAKAVLMDSEPSCVSSSCSVALNNMSADPDLIQDILNCFLVNASCQLFKRMFTNYTAGQLFKDGVRLSRYVTVGFLNNSETYIVRQMMSYLTANEESQQKTPTNCSDCLKRIISGQDKTLNVTWMQYLGPGSGDGDLCLCVESFTYSHSATSPVFMDHSHIGYGSHNYSTWAESSWNAVRMRVYLETYIQQEVGFFFVGIVMSGFTLLFSLICTYKGTVMFSEGTP